MTRIKTLASLIVCMLLFIPENRAGADTKQPNIIWVVVEDASPHISCYGETTIQTPHLDRLAAEGVKFTQAFVTCPVCSPSRSAMVTGMFQTTSGALHHRSQRTSGKWSAKANPFAESYALPDAIQLIPTLLQQAGYYVVNGGTGKTDYNFTLPPETYAGKDWKDHGEKPFFAQIHLRGGKYRQAKVENPVSPDDVNLPPYYPDSAVLRTDWARYLNSWLWVDKEVGELVAQLEQAGVLEETVIFFWTDHGISHARGKQFLYDEGIHVPLLVRYPGKQYAGTVRDDLVLHIDVSATTLQLAGLEIPDYIQGQSLIDEKVRPRRRIYAARDRCDETVDIIRCVRSKKFKYIRNFLPHISHMQPNRYKDAKDIVQNLRELHAEKKLTELQARIFRPRRDAEELYDLELDPHETHNLLKGTPDEQRGYRDTANEFRLALYQWMINSGDLGLITEPILEELGRVEGHKYGARLPKESSRVMWTIIETIEAGERHDVAALEIAAKHEHPAVRWWACTHLGLQKRGGLEQLQQALSDEFAGVRIAAAQALCLRGQVEQGLPVLEQEVVSLNRPAGMYAIRGLEMMGEAARPALPTILDAQKIPYDVTQRIAVRLANTLDMSSKP